MSDELHEMRRGLMAMRLEVPQSVADDVSARCEAAVARLTRERDAAMAVVDAARAYREAEMDGTPRFFRGKHLHDLGVALSTALAALSPSESPLP